jgi:hypothetical protein
MRPNKTIRSLLSALAAASLFTACVNDDRSAGVDEFPNSIYARLDGFLDEGKKSGQINPVPGLTDSLLGQPGFIVGAGKIAVPKVSAAGKVAAESNALQGLAKASAGAAACTSGTWTITDTVKASLKVTVNTLIICVDAKILDSIEGNETVVRGRTVVTHNGGRVETADITDADGDGILNPVAGKGPKANLVFSALEKGVLEKTVLVVGPGPDNDFKTESDNLVYSASWSKTLGTDTLAMATYADADSDGVAVDNGKASLVDLDFHQKGPSKDHPDAVWSRAQMRLVVRYQEEADEVKRVRFEMENKSGRRETGEILNLQGGRDFDMKDTVKARFLSVGADAADSLDTMDVNLIMKLGTDFDGKQDDSVYAIDVRALKKIGDEKLALFSFVSDRPIPSGKDPQFGTLSMSVEYGDGTTLKVEGEISSETMDVTVEDRTGLRRHIVWDREGRGISLEVLK